MPFPDVTNEEYVDTIKVNAENDIYYTCVYFVNACLSLYLQNND